MTLEEKIALAKQTAADAGVNASLFCAVIEQESGWDNWQIRMERGFEAKYVDPLKLPDTETIARSMSWGLGQVMGETARELGYKGPLAQLCECETGLYWSAVKLRRCLLNADWGVEQALSAYNGGSNPAYPAEVLARQAQYKG